MSEVNKDKVEEYLGTVSGKIKENYLIAKFYQEKGLELMANYCMGMAKAYQNSVELAKKLLFGGGKK